MDLPAGVRHDPAGNALEVRRGLANTLLFAVLLTVSTAIGLGVALGVARSPDLPLPVRVGVPIVALVALAGVWWLLRALWTAWWSLGPDGVTIHTATTRTYPWSDVVALEVILWGSAAAVNVRTTSGRSDSTPTRPLLPTIRRILRFAVDRGMVPPHVNVRL